MKNCLTWHPQNLQQSSPVLLWHHQFLQCDQEAYLHLPSPFPIWPTSHLSEKHLMLFLSKEWPGSSPSFIPSASSVCCHCAGNCICWLGCTELKRRGRRRRRGRGRSCCFNGSRGRGGGRSGKGSKKVGRLGVTLEKCNVKALFYFFIFDKIVSIQHKPFPFLIQFRYLYHRRVHSAKEVKSNLILIECY